MQKEILVEWGSDILAKWSISHRPRKTPSKITELLQSLRDVM